MLTQRKKNKPKRFIELKFVKKYFIKKLKFAKSPHKMYVFYQKRYQVQVFGQKYFNQLFCIQLIRNPLKQRFDRRKMGLLPQLL
jgi:ABC-type microcin C transport system permease subunit YejB